MPQCFYCTLCTCLLVLCLGTSCGGDQTRQAAANGGEEQALRDGEIRAQELVNLFRQTDSVVFSVYIVYQPPKREHLSFSLTGWAPADGRLRIRMTKLGVDFLEGLMEDNGTFTGVLVRDEKIIKGDVDQLMPKLEKKAGKEFENAAERKGAPLLALVELLRNEVKHGPINIRQDGYRLENKDGKEYLHFNLPHKFKATAILGSRRKNPVAEKIIYNPDGKEVMRLSYSRLKEHDGMQRLCQIKVELPGSDDKQTVILRELDAVRHIGADRMALDVPNYKEISIEDFGKKVVE